MLSIFLKKNVCSTVVQNFWDLFKCIVAMIGKRYLELQLL